MSNISGNLEAFTYKYMGRCRKLTYEHPDKPDSFSQRSIEGYGFVQLGIEYELDYKNSINKY